MTTPTSNYPDATTLLAELTDALAEVDRAQASARSHMPDGSLGDFPLPAELRALRQLADVARSGRRS